MTITPGPWKLKFEPIGNPADHSDFPFAHFLAGKDDEWDEVSNTGFHLAGIMNEDDARLMAAAPDLLEALLMVRHQNGNNQHFPCESMTVLNAAILKATGRS